MTSTQVAVVGGGPAGLSAAIAAARAGAKATLFDEQRTLGGQLRYRLGPLRQGLCEDLIEQAKRAGVDLRPGALAWSLFTDNRIGVVEGERSSEVQAERLILATGSTDLPLPFPGGSLPGVFTARAMLILLHVHRVRPGRRFVILGDAMADELAEAIEVAGGRIVARHDPTTSTETLRAGGSAGVTEVWIGARRMEADTVVVAVGRQPDIQLAQMAEVELGYGEVLGGWVPVQSPRLVTSNPGVIVAGDVAGVCDIPTAMAEGAAAGLRAVADLGLVPKAKVDAALEELDRVAPGRAAAVAALRSLHVQGVPRTASAEEIVDV